MPNGFLYRWEVCQNPFMRPFPILILELTRCQDHNHGLGMATPISWGNTPQLSESRLTTRMQNTSAGHVPLYSQAHEQGKPVSEYTRKCAPGITRLSSLLVSGPLSCSMSTC